MADLKRKGIVPAMPEVSLPYLRDYFLTVGPAMNGGMGAIAVTEEELAHFQGNRGLCFTPWEVDAIRRMSGEYVAELHAAEAHDRRPPWVRDFRERRREVARKIDLMFG